jgi:small-conductance mechanosensitive channel
MNVGKSTNVRARLLEFVFIVIAGVAAGLLARNGADRGLVPETYVLPIYALIIFVGGYLAIWIATGLLSRIVEPTVGATRSRGLRNALQLVGGIVLVVVVFATFGYNITGALVGAGFLGIVLGLAAQQVLGNVFAGLSLLVSKPFEIGDKVVISTSNYATTGSTYAHESQVSGFSGVVTDVGIFFTRIQLDNGTPAVLPNSVVIGAMIVNLTKTSERVVRVRMDIDRTVDFDSFKAKLLEALGRHDVIDSAATQVEIADVGTGTYQIAIVVRAMSGSEEPVKTVVIREGMRVRDQLKAAS